VVAGILAILVLDNNWAIFSGVMFISAGALVFGMRARYRYALRKMGISDKGRRILQIKTGYSDSLQLVWSGKYECGNNGIDAQHRKLFEMVNVLLDAVHGDRQQNEVAILVDRLHEDVKAHFSSEEKILEAWGHPFTEEHKQTHQSLLEKAVEIRARLNSRKLSYPEAVDFFVNELVLHHIVEEDKKFFYQV
jgi:hemerythrin-like metal-binding protein